MNWDIGTDIYTYMYTLLILCIKQITDVTPVSSTGNSTQCSVVTSMGRKSKKRGDICVHVADSLCCTAETDITLRNNCMPIKINNKECGNIVNLVGLQGNLRRLAVCTWARQVQKEASPRSETSQTSGVGQRSSRSILAWTSVCVSNSRPFYSICSSSRPSSNCLQFKKKKKKSSPI